MDIKPMEYPKEAIEHLVEQIIKLHVSKHHGCEYSVALERSIDILNEGLSLLVKPYLVIGGKKND